MKKSIVVLAILAAVVFTSCQAKDAQTGGAATDTAAKSEKPADSSYAFGVAIGTSLQTTGVKIDYTSFLKGVKDVMDKKTPKMTIAEASQVIQDAMTVASQKMAVENLAAETDFFAKNGKKEGVMTTASGLQYEVLKEGSGANPKETDTIRVDYIGSLLDGTTFDSSIARGEPAEFALDGVIPGWTEGIQLMKVGGKTKFYIPSKLAYGESGAGSQIPPNTTLVFEVDLLDILTPVK